MSISEKLNQNKENFISFNHYKFERFQQLIPSANVKKIINAIPLLLSVNEKKIPGYVDGNAPFGIVNYKPDETTLKFIQAKFHIKNIHINTDTPFIQMIALMGSVGTIAYSKKSDFDYWVCIDRHSVSSKMLENFQKKINAIQQWAMDETKIEVHLFINDIESIKQNIFAEDDEEAFGSTTGAVLKDEFYRSSIVIAGKIPFWWVVPRFISNAEYDKLLHSLPRDVYDNEFIDLGNLREISKEDFLGAALFQIIKSLGNPFKSIIKIGVLEKYLFGPDESPLLSQKVKTHIHRGNFDNKILDAYILMFEEVYDHYESVLVDKKLLKILRQNLYLKIDPQLSKYRSMTNTQKMPYKVVEMLKYVNEWKWSAKEIKDLDNFNNWDYKKIMRFWDTVRDFMRLSYQKISEQLPKLSLAQQVSESDFKLLTRKIQTHFKTEPNKIDNYITFKDTPHESILYIEPVDKSIDQHEWKLFKRNTSSKDKFLSTELRVDKSLVKLLSWLAINQIFNPTFSRLKIQSGYSRINQNLVVELLTKISNLFLSKSTKLKNEYFLDKSFTLVNMIIFNFTCENIDTIKTIHHLYMTSWGESYIDEYKSITDLIKILETMLNDAIKLSRPFDAYVVIDTPEPFKKTYRELEKLIKEMYDFIVVPHPKKSLSFTTKIDNNFLVVNRDRDKVSVSTYTNPIQMLSTISLTPKKDITHTFHGDDSRLNILHNIYEKKKRNACSIVYEEVNEFLFIYLINERGNLFTFIKHKTLKEEALISLYSFAKSSIEQINNIHSLANITTTITVNKLTVDRFGKLSFTNDSRTVDDIYQIKYKNKPLLQARILKYKDTTAQYKFHFSDKSESGYISANGLPQLIASKKNQVDPKNLYLDQIVFEDLKQSDHTIGTTLYFLEKYRLELIIEKALKN